MAEVVKGPIGDVVSEPITTTGDAKQIAKRGETCMAQILKPGQIGAQTIIASDVDAGRIVGRNAFSFTDYFMFPTSYDGRTRVVFEAKDGRFRISHTQTETFDKLIKEWIPANNLSKKRNGYLEMTTSITEELSKCVVAAGNSNW